MSATMGYTAVAALSHELETLLDRVRRGERSVDARLMDLLFRSADLLERAIESAVSGVEAVDVSPMVAQLQAEAGSEGGTPALGQPVVPMTTAESWTAAIPAGPGMLVRVRIIAGTPLKGVRAFLAVQAARKLGEVGAVSPSL